jgi:hypothetical protein
MRRISIVCVAAVAATLAVWGGSAAASGPAPPGKEILEVTCGSEMFNIAVPRPEDAFGVAQVVGQTGHAIPVTVTLSVLDVTTDELLDSGSTAVGDGHAHPNQTTTSCTVVLFEGTAADLFGSDPLPPGIAPTDIIRVSLTIDVIIQP